MFELMVQMSLPNCTLLAARAADAAITKHHIQHHRVVELWPSIKTSVISVF